MIRSLVANRGSVQRRFYIWATLMALVPMTLMLALGCAAEPPAPTTTPNISATITAGVATRIATQSATLRPTATTRSSSPPTPEPTPTATPRPTKTPRPTPTPEPTPTATPRPTKTPRPTSTPLTPVSINSDCVGCPVVAPGASKNQQVMEAYAEWAGAKKHPDPVVLVTCNRGDRVSGVGYIMGARGNNVVSADIAVTGRSYPSTGGGCYAITAKYDGLKEVCIERFSGSCTFGTGDIIEILGFKSVGESTEISTSQYQTLLKYARVTQYQVGSQ